MKHLTEQQQTISPKILIMSFHRCDVIACIYASIRKMSRRIVVALQRLNNKCRETTRQVVADALSSRCILLHTAVLPCRLIVDVHIRLSVCV